MDGQGLLGKACCALGQQQPCRATAAHNRPLMCLWLLWWWKGGGGRVGGGKGGDGRVGEGAQQACCHTYVCTSSQPRMSALMPTNNGPQTSKAVLCKAPFGWRSGARCPAGAPAELAKSGEEVCECVGSYILASTRPR